MNLHIRQPVVQPVDGSYRLIPLTQGQIAIVDAADYDWLMQWPWFAHWSPNSRSYNAVRSAKDADGKPITIVMARQIMQATDDRDVDHENHTTLDNRRSNLRLATDGQNQHNKRKYRNNTSGIKGVSWDKRSQKWFAKIAANGHQRNLGLFATPEEAGAAYQRAARELHGEFACFN